MIGRRESERGGNILFYIGALFPLYCIVFTHLLDEIFRTFKTSLKIIKTNT